MADQEVISHKCSVCNCDYTEDEGGVEGNFGILPVSFCPTCFSCMSDMASQYIEPDPYEEEEIKPEYAEFMKQLKGVRKVVINRCHGGFGLSFNGKVAYLEAAGIPFTLEEQADRDTQNRLGPRVMVNGEEFWGRTIPRDDPALVRVVKKLRERANSEFADLRVVEIPGDIEWDIEDYDGLEWVAEVHRTWR